MQSRDLLRPSSNCGERGVETSRFRRTSAVSVEIHVPEVVAEQPSQIRGEGCVASNQPFAKRPIGDSGYDLDTRLRHF